MKLSSEKLGSVLEQIDAEVIPDDHPSLPKLREVFGDHTFFLDQNGLNIVEPADPMQEDAPIGQVVNVASWSDDDPKTLAPHEPELTDVVVVLQARH